ncbi:MAG: hypothetical protein NTV63_00380 [Candidatus Woesearchaeota archaeon]|nr:hypothetical protein [Candidatus Woesearchaeota archaeon]
MLSAFIKKLLFSGEFMIEGGRVEVLEERELMLPSLMLARIQEMAPEKVYSIAKESMKEEIDRFTRKVGNSKAEMIVMLKNFFDTIGIGSIEVEDLDMIKKRSIVRIHDNAVALVNALEKKKTPCMLAAGILAGIFSSIFDSDCDCEEKACVLKGSAYCEFTIKTR